MQTTELDQTLKQYLLGNLPAVERIEVENRYLSEEDVFHKLQVAEDELIDDYVRRNLSRADRDRFEQNFLCSAARRERVKSARALQTFADTHAAAARLTWWQRLWQAVRQDSPALRIAFAIALLVVIIGGSLVYLQIRNLRSGLHGLQAEQLAQRQREEELARLLAQQKEQNEALRLSLDRERSERGQLEQEVARLREQQTPPITFGLGLGSGEPENPWQPETKVQVPRGAEVIKLELDLFKDEYAHYLIVLQDAQGKEIWRGLLASTKAGTSRAVVVRLPARLFTTGTYRLTLSGTNDKSRYDVISEFSFTLSKS